MLRALRNAGEDPARLAAVALLAVWLGPAIDNLRPHCNDPCAGCDARHLTQSGGRPAGLTGSGVPKPAPEVSTDPPEDQGARGSGAQG
jgi:hypothetical protein